MKEVCENCRLIAYSVVKLQVVKIEELDVCGSLDSSHNCSVLHVLLYGNERMLCMMQPTETLELS